ncbi:MAG: acVLRF1 family peptidyl-tRNA hydrolase, partial [Thermocrispum sp.]
MSRVREVAGGGRAVEVIPERVAAWFDGFAARNGGVTRTVLADRQVRVVATDGTTATVDLPFEPLGQRSEHDGLEVSALVTYAQRPRRLGLLLARKGAHSVGVADGARVIRSRTDRHHVQGRTAAGGWSQQRFARRREQQGRQALARAADDVLEVLGGELATLDAVVLGGDRRALD